MVAPPLGRATRLLRFMNGFGFQHSQTVVGVKDHVFVAGLAPFFFEFAPHYSQLPHAHRGMRRIAVWNRKVLLEVGIIKVDPADISWVTPDDELAFA